MEQKNLRRSDTFPPSERHFRRALESGGRARAGAAGPLTHAVICYIPTRICGDRPPVPAYPLLKWRRTRVIKGTNPKRPQVGQAEPYCK
jgi:hypothetical protein